MGSPQNGMQLIQTQGRQAPALHHPRYPVTLLQPPCSLKGEEFVGPTRCVHAHQCPPPFRPHSGNPGHPEVPAWLDPNHFQGHMGLPSESLLYRGTTALV